MFLQWKLQFHSNKILVEYGSITWQSDSKLKEWNLGKYGNFEGKALGPCPTRCYETTIIWTQCCGHDEQNKRNKYLAVPSVVM